MKPYFLAIETATKMCSVALFQESSLLDVLEADGEYSHAEKLAPFIEDLLARNELQLADLAAVAVCSGPGSYTGLRIGLSTAKALCFAAEIPLISISSLKAMAKGAVNQLKDEEAIYCPMIDARRMEVYTALYDAHLKEIKPTQAAVIDETFFNKERSERTFYFFGDGAAKCRSVLDQKGSHLVEEEFISARHWGELILKKFQNRDFEDLAYYEPYYYKDFRAGKSKPMV